jgi:hypothetical protein
MDMQRQNEEVDRNYDVFMRMLADLLPGHRDEYALMRDGKIIGFYAKPGDANRAGVETFPDQIFSIQEVTDEPIDLGFWSHVAIH